MSAFERGWLDAVRGIAFAACPYHWATGAAIAWRAGHRAMWESVGLRVTYWLPNWNA